jgi:hypothetical protein
VCDSVLPSRADRVQGQDVQLKEMGKKGKQEERKRTVAVKGLF